MAENMMNSEHKATNKAYRDNYDAIFKRCDKCDGTGEILLDRGAWRECECVEKKEK